MKSITSHFPATQKNISALQEELNRRFPEAEVEYSALIDSWKISQADLKHEIQFNQKKQSKIKTTKKQRAAEVVARIVPILLIISVLIFVRKQGFMTKDISHYIFLFLLVVYSATFDYLWIKLHPADWALIQSEHNSALKELNSLTSIVPA